MSTETHDTFRVDWFTVSLSSLILNKKILDENFVFRFINVRSCQAGLFEDELELGLEIDDRCEPVVESVKTLNFDGIPKQVRFVERCGCPKAKRN